MRSPSTSTSAANGPLALTTVPALMSVFTCSSLSLFAGRSSTSGRGQTPVAVRSAVAVERPRVADLLQDVHVEVTNNDVVVGVRRRVTDLLTSRVDEVRRPVEIVVAELSDAHPVEGADEVLIGDRGRGLFEVPEVRGQSATGRRGVKDDSRASEAQRPPTLGEMTVVADVHADRSDGGLEDRITEIAGAKVELLPEPLDLGKMVLAVLAQIRAVGVDDERGVVEDALLFDLVDRHDEDHTGFARELAHHLARWTRDGLGVREARRVLHLTEVRTVEQLLETEDLSALTGGLAGEGHVGLDHRLFVAGPLGLYERCAHDVRSTFHVAHPVPRSLGIIIDD